ncbi:MAG: beta-phosphoglucomutase family hydrolase [Bacteroidales bacterium]
MSVRSPHFDAVIFDLDGVITQTALVHAAAWKKMFDEYLRVREEKHGEPFREFTHAGDYLPFVDGKPRYKGVASFLESRSIDIPFGDPSDDPALETACGLGNRKNIMFNRVLDEEGVDVYPTSVQLLEDLKKAGYRIGVASSSKNCKPVLEKAGLLHFFETRVDGVVSAEIGLKGKPEPDIFTTACDNLGVAYHRAVVVEDAVSGVEAGRKGNFGFVLGVAREENTRELLIGGADVVVEDIGDIGLKGIEDWFASGIETSGWELRYHDYDKQKERSREALLAVGNGYFGTRGAMEECRANAVNYPGTYVSGLFNRRVSQVADRDIENEDFVNISNWLPVSFRIGSGSFIEFNEGEDPGIRLIDRTLDMRKGELRREMILEDSEGRRTRVRSSRFASMADPHLAGVRYRITPLNYSGSITLRSELTGDHENAGVERYRQLNQQHLKPVRENIRDGQLELTVTTTQSGIDIALAARNKVHGSGGVIKSKSEKGPGWVRQEIAVEAREGQDIELEKRVTLATSRDPEGGDPTRVARDKLAGMGSFEEELARSEAAWKALWDRMDIRIGGDREAQRLIRLHTYHMLVTASPHHAGLDAGIPPRGLHGEAYRGHIFWDELYILPLYNLHLPEVTRSVLMYRYNRLEAARAYASVHGYEGAMFPWQSGSDGREETQVIHLNPLSGEWGDDYSSLQRHISLAIACNAWNYYHSTGDLAFMEEFGAELLLDICKFWVSKMQRGADGRYHIDKVMGPDEFHEKLPGSPEGGVRDNAYSNLMASWILGKGLSLLPVLGKSHKERILGKIGVTEKDLARWEETRTRLCIHVSEEGIAEQFEGYFGLQELDWEHYKRKYGNIHRLDRILKAEDKSPDDYKLSKQADFLMTFYNLGEKEVRARLADLGYDVPPDFLAKNFDYYMARTSHGSTLSRLVHARLAWLMDRRELAWGLYTDALRSDLIDIQGGTTGEGIHCGVMAGTVVDALVAFAGLRLDGEEPVLNPRLPDHWTGMEFSFSFRGRRFRVSITPEVLKISLESSGKAKIKVHLCGKAYEIAQHEAVSVNLKDR